MAATESMMDHLRAIRLALESFATTKGSDSRRAVIRVWPSEWADNVHAVISIPEFDAMRSMDRQNEVWEYLRSNLPPSHRSRLSSLRTLSTDEWAKVEQEPSASLLGT